MAASEFVKIIFQFQGGQASQALENLNETFKETQKVAKGAGKGVDDFEKEAKQAAKPVKSLKDAVFSLKGAVVGFVAAIGAFKAYRFVKESTMVAARYKTLGVVLEQVGKQAGMSSKGLFALEQGLQDSGIAGLEARQVLVRMMQAQLDVNRALDLGRVAQNAAVIANLNSSETFERMIHAIQANSVEILRTIGLNVSFERSYRTFAQQLGVGVDQLTEAQKVQARFNAVVAAGSQITGAYEASMTTAGKQILSFSRYMQTFRRSLGEAFEPMLAVIVKGATDAMKVFIEVIQDPGFQEDLRDFADAIGEQIRIGFQWLIDNKQLILDVIVRLGQTLNMTLMVFGKVLDAVLTTEEKIERKRAERFNEAQKTLLKYRLEREKLIETMKNESAWQDKLDFGKKERRLKTLNALIDRYEKLVTEIQKVSRAEDERKRASMPPPRGEAARLGTGLEGLEPIQDTVVKDTTKLLATPIERLMAVLTRLKADVELELANLDIRYQDNLISITEYYRKRVELASEVFEKEMEYLEELAASEQNPAKRLKIETQMYVLEKRHLTEMMRLEDQRRQAQKEAERERVNIGSMLSQGVGAVGGIEARHATEQMELQRRQDERIQTILNSKLDEQSKLMALEDAYRLNQLEKDKLQAKQRLEVQRMYLENVAGMLSNLNSMFGDLYEASGRKTKQFARMQKAIAIAQTIISTYESAQKAYNAMASIPYVGPALGAIAAATAVAAGLARVAAIRAQKLAGGGKVEGTSPHSKADNIPIMATADEYMQPVAAVKKYGIGFMESVRNLTFPVDIARQFSDKVKSITIPRGVKFAEGGLVAAGVGMGTQAVTNNINVTVNGDVENPYQKGREIGRGIRREFVRNLREEMRPGGLLFRR